LVDRRAHDSDRTRRSAGLTTDIRQLARSEWRPLVVAIIGLTVVTSVSLGIVLLTFRALHRGVGQ
jgi:Kef-type K+ transport system membrane component KefB